MSSQHTHGLTNYATTASIGFPYGSGPYGTSGGGYMYTDPATGTVSYVAPGTFATLPNGAVISGGPWTTSAPQLPPVELPVEPRSMPVIGYRGWNWASKFRLGVGQRGALHSAIMSNTWKQGRSSAICMSSGNHIAPDPNCGCGLYVVADLDELDGHVTIADNLVVGAVVGWGRVVQHGREGWRAQHCRILALLDCKYSDAQLKTTREAAKEYKLPVLERDGLEKYVREWGDPFGA